MSNLSGSKLEQIFKSGVISNINSADLTADVTIDAVLYETVDIHYHCNAAATQHGNPFVDGDNVVVIFNFDDNLPVAIVGFVDSPKTCGDVLIELDDGTKEIYNINDGSFSTYDGEVEIGNRYFYCYETDVGCDENFGSSNSHTTNTINYGDECPPDSEWFLTTTVRHHDFDYSSDYGTISEFTLADDTFLYENCINCGGAGTHYASDIYQNGSAHKGNTNLSMSGLHGVYPLLNQVTDYGIEDTSKYPSVVNNSIIGRFLVLSYASDRAYSNIVTNNPDCETTQAISFLWDDYVTFCDNGVCEEFEHTSGSTSISADRYQYTITDFYVYIHQYKESSNIFFSVFLANGTYYCHVGKNVGSVFTISRDSVFEARYNGLNISKIQLLD